MLSDRQVNEWFERLWPNCIVCNERFSRIKMSAANPDKGKCDRCEESTTKTDEAKS